MTDSMAQARGGFTPRLMELAGWKSALCWSAAVLVSLLFLVSGVWKITDVQAAAIRMAQARVPQSLSLAAALGVGIAETFGGVLVLVPRYRRWGALLTGLLLVAFMIYMGVNYHALLGEDCSCFPWVKRVVGPGFFIGDTVMLLLAAVAGMWAKPSGGLRGASLVLGAVVVFALVSYGADAARRTGTKAPDTITVAGQPYSLAEGRVFLFFFNPQCTHCYDASERMAKLQWGDTRVVAVPVEQAQFADQFLSGSGLHAVVTQDFALLKDVFSYSSYPFGVALEGGRQKATLTKFEDPEPIATLRELGFAR
jgi:uncharacterized membrane protein YphA (DoxX/SURF4 family)